MSYEGQMLHDLNMPPRKAVELALLKSLFFHNGVIKEFGNGEDIVDEIANDFSLKDEQRNAQLETIYKKENRLKKSNLWHRLLFRAADNLAKEKLISRPTHTILLTSKREWMLTEEGYDKVLQLLNIPLEKQNKVQVKSFEVQKIVKKIIEKVKPIEYDPLDKSKKSIRIIKDEKLRRRGFRQAIIEAYEYKCSICGLKLNSPNNLIWEVEAAHIVPHNLNGKDDIWNGLALCHLHHWAFDVGWFYLDDNYRIVSSVNTKNIINDNCKIGNFNFIEHLSSENLYLMPPINHNNYPHVAALRWHRENIFSNLNNSKI